MNNGRRLIFYFYAMDGYRDNDAYKMHFACLKKYRDVFDTAKFFISVDNPENRELISNVASDIVKCGFVENTEFTVVRNGMYREAGIFKEEVVDKMDTLSGLTFFAHTKGVSNVLVPECNKDSILEWIFGCYYLSLEFLEDVHNQTQVYQPFCQRYFYGSFLKNVTAEEGGGTKYGPEYEGTFYWINCTALYDYLVENEIDTPKNIGRFYAERFPGDLFKVKSLHVGSYKYRYFFGDASLYNDCDGAVGLLLFEEDAKRFRDGFKEIKEQYGL